MGVANAYSNDIFISYSHIDNESFGDDRGGWVDIFHAQLQQFVDVHVGRRTKVWRDKRLTGAEVFSDEIEQQLRSSAVLVTVVSPGYLQSEWCNRELVGFTDLAQRQGDLRVGNLQRVVKVLRLPVERSALPPLLDEALGAQFFRVDAASGRARDLLVDESADAERVFRARVDDVAQDLCRLLVAMSEPVADVTGPPASTGDTVFLAWTSSDLSEERETLRRELEARSYRVVPADAPPIDAAGLRASVVDALREAKVAIHLIGAVKGFVPEGETSSVVEIQCDEAVSLASGAQSIVWLATTETPRDPQLSLLIDRLQTQSPGIGGLDVLANQSLEDLKTLVLDRLSPVAKAAPEIVKTAAPLVYLICDQLDRADVAPIEDFLFNQSLEVRLPLSDGDSEQVRSEHYELLKECEGVLLYWGKANEAWLRTMLRDLNKVFGLGRAEDYTAKALYLANLPDATKEAFRTHQVSIIGAEHEFEPGVLSSFVSALSQ
jgi:hypothetical protein